MYHDFEGREIEDGEMDNMRREADQEISPEEIENMRLDSEMLRKQITLEQIEEGLNVRILEDARTHDYADLLRYYEVLAQVKQAMAAERQAKASEELAKHLTLLYKYGVRTQS